MMFELIFKPGFDVRKLHLFFLIETTSFETFDRNSVPHQHDDLLDDWSTDTVSVVGT